MNCQLRTVKTQIDITYSPICSSLYSIVLNNSASGERRLHGTGRSFFVYSCSRRLSFFVVFFFILFLQNKVVTFCMNHLPSRRFTWNFKSYFLWKNRTNNNKKQSNKNMQIKNLRMSATKFAWRFNVQSPFSLM